MMYLSNKVQNHDGDDLELPRNIQILQQNSDAFPVVDRIRWPTAKHCPRCDSVYVKTVNTAIFRELYRCVDCGYMFNSFSGTLFHGTKIPVVKYFQFFVLHDASGNKLSPRDVSYAISISNKTAVSLINRIERLKTVQGSFTCIDKEKATALRSSSEIPDQGAEYENFFSYCETKHILVSRGKFFKYLEYVIRQKFEP